jgi:hypothetical protein
MKNAWSYTPKIARCLIKQRDIFGFKRDEVAKG